MFFAWQAPENPQTLRIDHGAGANMTVIGTVGFVLAIWALGLLLTAYLVWGPRRTAD